MALPGIWMFCGYLVVFYIGQIVIGNYRHVRKIRRREAPGKLILTLVAVTLLPIALNSMKHQQPLLIPMIIGGLIVVLGFLFSMWAQWELGIYWVGGIGLHKNHRLITTGPYRFVRHPLYTGMLISAGGLSIFGWNILYALMAFAFAGGFVIRGIGEEYALMIKFTKQYPRYRETTGMLFPRVRKRG